LSYQKTAEISGREGAVARHGLPEIGNTEMWGGAVACRRELPESGKDEGKD